MPIRTVIVDDDFMTVSVNRQFVERISGFEVVGTATSGAEALRLIAVEHPDLLLLDIYLPDISGIDMLRRLRATPGVPVDVIAITSAKDVDTLRDAMHLGVVQYIIKPFNFRTLHERLDSFAIARERIDRMAQADQPAVDKVYGALRSSGSEALPKNISAPTLSLLAGVVRRSDHPLTAGEIAAKAGISQGIARRYLRYLSESGAVDYALRYGSAGRPEHLYRWANARHG